MEERPLFFPSRYASYDTRISLPFLPGHRDGISLMVVAPGNVSSMKRTDRFLSISTAFFASD
jgi:hypothetical protein